MVKTQRKIFLGQGTKCAAMKKSTHWNQFFRTKKTRFLGQWLATLVLTYALLNCLSAMILVDSNMSRPGPNAMHSLALLWYKKGKKQIGKSAFQMILNRLQLSCLNTYFSWRETQNITSFMERKGERATKRSNIPKMSCTINAAKLLLSSGALNVKNTPKEETSIFAKVAGKGASMLSDLAVGHADSMKPSLSSACGNRYRKVHFLAGPCRGKQNYLWHMKFDRNIPEQWI